jgi:hypothetical protein
MGDGNLTRLHTHSGYALDQISLDFISDIESKDYSL